jgi:hypothetical protein
MFDLNFVVLQCNFFLAINLQCALMGIGYLCGNMLGSVNCYICSNMVGSVGFEGNDMGMWSVNCFKIYATL